MHWSMVFPRTRGSACRTWSCVYTGTSSVTSPILKYDLADWSGLNMLKHSSLLNGLFTGYEDSISRVTSPILKKYHLADWPGTNTLKDFSSLNGVLICYENSDTASRSPPTHTIPLICAPAHKQPSKRTPLVYWNTHLGCQSLHVCTS